VAQTSKAWNFQVNIFCFPKLQEKKGYDNGIKIDPAFQREKDLLKKKYKSGFIKVTPVSKE
jgi:hypothetical protein